MVDDSEYSVIWRLPPEEARKSDAPIRPVPELARLEDDGGPPVEPAVTVTREILRERLLSILGKHIRLSDEVLSDRDFVDMVMKRFKKFHGHYLVDVNE